MKSVRVRYALSLAMNMAIVMLTVYSVSIFYVSVGSGNMAVNGSVCFRYFTVLSNVLAALCSCAVIPYSYKSLVNGIDALPHWAILTKLTAGSAVSVTLVVVLVFLGPTMGYGMMFVGGSLHLHLICPLLAIFSFCFLENGGSITKKEALWGALPSAIYGTLYLIMVVIIGQSGGGWPDFYGFNMNGMWYISYPAIILGTYGLCLLLRIVHNRKVKVLTH